LINDWYDKLKKYADWSYKDNIWYSIVGTLLKFDDLDESILIDIASAPLDVRNFSFLEGFRDKAVNHKNATMAVKKAAFASTRSNKYIPEKIANILFL
jgi:hypothetical protein